MHDKCMKDQIKDWLKAFNHDRPWLAEQIGVKPRTVDNWLSSPQVIPEGKIALIKRLIQDDEDAESARRQKLQPTAQLFSLEVDLTTFRRYTYCASAQGLMLEQWAIQELNNAAENYMSGDNEPTHLPQFFKSGQLNQNDPKPSASTVKPGATTQTPIQPAQAAASPSNITALPPQHIAAEETAEYQVKPPSRKSS